MHSVYFAIKANSVSEMYVRDIPSHYSV